MDGASEIAGEVQDTREMALAMMSRLGVSERQGLPWVSFNRADYEHF
jgi:hypothetical protein